MIYRDPSQQEKLLQEIDKNIDIPLQSLVLGRKKNAEFRETLWRTTLVNILLDDEVTKLIEKERKQLVDTVLAIERIDLSSSKTKKLKLPDFLKKVVKFIIYGID